MKYAVLNGNLVVNVIDADADFAASIGAVECPRHVSIGWSLNAGEWVEPVPPPVPVPQVVTMRQARLALLGVGKLDDVAAAIAGLPSPQKEAAQVEWEYSTEVKRDSALVTQLAPALGLDAAALDALFTQAATL